MQQLTGLNSCRAESKVPVLEFQKLVAELNKGIDEEALKTPGDFHQWAELWATDSVHQAEKVFNKVSFGAATLDPNNSTRFKKITIKLPATYSTDQLPRSRTQIAKAGVHLAQLLNSIDRQ